MTDNWIYNNIQLTDLPQDEKLIGFVYCITNLTNGRKYYGKKKSHFKKTSLKTVTLKTGIKKKKKISKQVESDWRSYYGSSDELAADVEKLGRENFKREILTFCYSLGDLSYQEAKIQFTSDCLLYPEKYYNSWISCRVRRAHLIKK